VGGQVSSISRKICGPSPFLERQRRALSLDDDDDEKKKRR
jgi:hypothetical protein